MLYNSLGILSDPFFLAILAGACAFDAEIEVLGNIYDSTGKPIEGLTADFCYDIRFGKEVDTQCLPMSTDGHGQFTLNMYSAGDYNSPYSGYHFYIRTEDEKKYSGQVIRDDVKRYEGSIYGSLVANFVI